jgi:ubiquinone/menaquinone biosynthesis C-methylase UbiE
MTDAVPEDTTETSAPGQEGAREPEPRGYARVREIIRRGIGSFSRVGDLDDLYEPQGHDILDYGWAGDGDRALGLLERGAASVSGFDLWWKDQDLERVSERMRALGLDGRTDFRLADPYATPFPDDSFDVVIGAAILLHLDLERALGEIRRVLRPGGRGVFVEPLAHNPILRAGRVLTSRTHADSGSHFTASDWAVCARVFPGFEHFERELSTIPLMPLNLLLPARAQPGLARRAWSGDEWLMSRFPGLRKHARITFLVLQ